MQNPKELLSSNGLIRFSSSSLEFRYFKVSICESSIKDRMELLKVSEPGFLTRSASCLKLTVSRGASSSSARSPLRNERFTCSVSLGRTKMKSFKLTVMLSRSYLSSLSTHPLDLLSFSSVTAGFCIFFLKSTSSLSLPTIKSTLILKDATISSMMSYSLIVNAGVSTITPDFFTLRSLSRRLRTDFPNCWIKYLYSLTLSENFSSPKVLANGCFWWLTSIGWWSCFSAYDANVRQRAVFPESFPPMTRTRGPSTTLCFSRPKCNVRYCPTQLSSLTYSDNGWQFQKCSLQPEYEKTHSFIEPWNAYSMLGDSSVPKISAVPSTSFSLSLSLAATSNRHSWNGGTSTMLALSDDSVLVLLRIDCRMEGSKQQLENAQLSHEEPAEEPELTLENVDDFIQNSDFKKLLETENEIIQQLNSNEAEIKSIIYNNYYELIKINDVLMDLKSWNGEDDGVGENLQKIRNKIQSLRTQDFQLLPEPVEVRGEKVSKSINKLLLDNKIDKKTADAIDDSLPELSGESLLLQMNELKNK
ncbi:hypothetical protein OGATHE_003147 [Ogataea polymorpha]|uniref:Vacuolar protein sorting-associated protein 51 homolog n=1 Tax=Ogataea polymorpha TaxID=460523 RepID=A0A9P8T6P2_9ASCO|nr:hypothetical protein OGATHE_003147 [Ogataea polymorpha]